MTVGTQKEIGRTLVDHEAYNRYLFVAEKGIQLLGNTNLIEGGGKISSKDLRAIEKFHREVSPVNPSNQWRLKKRVFSGNEFSRGEIKDPSYFGNWESPGGPLEHIELATAATGIILTELKANLKDETQEDKGIAEAINELKKLNPYLIAATAALHDEGREITHTFFRNELVGEALLRRIGIREQILDIMPGEDVMQMAPEDSLVDKIFELSPSAVIVRIADELGKRKSGTNRLISIEDYGNKWAKNYEEKPPSGWGSDAWMRQSMQLHIDNTPRYFRALDIWVKAVSNLTLENLSEKLNGSLSPGLKQI